MKFPIKTLDSDIFHFINSHTHSNLWEKRISNDQSLKYISLPYLSVVCRSDYYNIM